MSNELIVPPSESPNLAPLADLQKYLDENGQPQRPFSEWLKAKCTDLDRQRDPEWRELHLTWELNDKFIEGKQILRRKHRGTGWDPIPLPESTTGNIREQNKLGFYSRNLLSKWVASRTKIAAIAGDDSDQAIGAARAAQVWYDALAPMIYDEKFRQSEGLAAQIHGVYARYFYYDPEADGGYGFKPITETRNFKAGEDMSHCLACGHSGLSAEFGAMGDETGLSPAMPTEMDAAEGPEAPEMMEMAPARACPACGAAEIEDEPAPEVPIEAVTGVEQYKLGNLRAISVPYSQLRHELASSAEESPWLRWKRRVRIEELKAKFPKLQIPVAEGQERDSGLEYEESMRRATAMNNAATRGPQRGRESYADFTQWWFKPCMYSDYVFPTEVQTVAGETIPAGTRAADLFPDGMYIARIDGLDAPLQVRNECHTWHWVTSPYKLRLFTGIGLGINDAVEMQRQWNLVLSLLFTQIRTAALPGYLYDKDAVSPDDVRKVGQPQNNIPVSLRNRPEGTRIEQLIHQMAPGQVPGHIFAYINQLDANMQTSMGALVNEGVPGMDSKTATGAQLMASASQQHNAPEFALKGDADVRSAYVLFELAKKHYVEPRYLPLSGKRGKTDGIWLSGADFANGQVRFEAVKDSWLPNTKLDKQESMQKLLMMFGGVPGLLQAQGTMPDLVSDIAEAFGIDIAGDVFEPTALMCRNRVEQIKQLAPQFAPVAEQAMQMAAMMPMVDEMGAPIDPLMQIGDAIVQGLQPEVVVEEPAHMLSVKWLRELLLDDEMKEADPVTRAGVRSLIRLHLQMAAMEAQVMAQFAAMSQPPMPEEGAEGEPGGMPPQKTPADKRKDSAKANMGGGEGAPGGRPSPRPAKIGT